MKVPLCQREDELLDALGRGYIGEELEAHAASCAACSELRTVAGALLEDRREAIMEAHVPSSGAMWFRMLIRSRQEAQATARRSLLIGQAATLVVALTLVGTFFGADLVVSAREWIAAIHLSTPVLLMIATWLLVAPIAGWVAIRQK